jgi:hypothetical protein
MRKAQILEFDRIINAWHPHRVAGAETNEGRGHRARQQDGKDGLGSYG